jgi:hydrogenase maturation protease
MLRLIGLGSPHGDDAIGWLLVRALAETAGSELQVSVVAAPADLLGLLSADDTVILVDACDLGERPGTVLIRDWPVPLASRHRAASSHGFGLGDVLCLAGSLGRLPASVTVLGVQLARVRPGGGLSPELQAVLPELEAALRRLVAEKRLSITERR